MRPSGYTVSMDDPCNRAQGAPGSIVVVDDEAAIAELVVQLLEAEGLRACAFTDPLAALDHCGRAGFVLAIVDVMMPQMTGFELCAKLRSISDAPIVFLSARDEEVDQVAGFSFGADDYVVKPFKPRELVARVRAHLRRSQREGRSNAPSALSACGIELDPDSHAVALYDEPLTLTPKEFAVLELLMRRGGKPVPAAEIFETVWGERFDDAAANTVMVHIRHLRAKLAAVDSSRSFIQTVWGVGYRLGVEPAAQGSA